MRTHFQASHANWLTSGIHCNKVLPELEEMQTVAHTWPCWSQGSECWVLNCVWHRIPTIYKPRHET